MKLEELKNELYKLENLGNRVETIYRWMDKDILGVHLGDINRQKEIFILGCQHAEEYQSAEGILDFCKKYDMENHLFAVPVVDVLGFDKKRTTLLDYFPTNVEDLCVSHSLVDINRLYASNLDPARSILLKALEYDLILDSHINVANWGYGFICFEYMPKHKKKLHLGRNAVKEIRKKNLRVMDSLALSAFSGKNVEDGIIYNYFTPGELTTEAFKYGKYGMIFEFQRYTDKPSKHGRKLSDEEIGKIVSDVLHSVVTYSLKSNSPKHS
jgi:hypothetical protein